MRLWIVVGLVCGFAIGNVIGRTTYILTEGKLEIEWIDCVKGHYMPILGQFSPYEFVCDIERGLREDGVVVWREVKQ